MKKTSLFFAVILFAGMLFCSQAMAQGRIELGVTKSAQQCTNLTNDGFTASFSFSSIEANTVKTEKGEFSDLFIENTYPTGNAGEPSLPAAHQLIAVPYGAKNVTATVVSYTTKEYKLADFGIKTIMPQQYSLRKDQDPSTVPFEYNTKAYATKGYLSRDIVEFEILGTMRGVQVGSLTVNPVVYNPATGSIKVYNDIKVEVSYGQYDKAAAESEFERTASFYFKGIYSTLFNWRDDVYDQHPDIWDGTRPVKMLVITNRMFENTIQEWVNWKTIKGIHMDVHYTDEPGVGTTAASIKSFIQNKYNTEAPTFIIIIGDKNQVAASATGSESRCVTDLYYMSVDNDYFPDMLHSRMPAETVSDMEHILEKILVYEQYLMPDPSYLNNVLLIAGWDSNWNPKVGKPTIQYASNYYYNAEHGFANVYEFLSTPYNNPYASLNTGVGFVNYTAHGGNTEWSNPNLSNSGVNNLTNQDKYFLAMGNCCQAADWGISGASFGEAMIRAEKKAAYTYIGSCPSTYWWEDYYFGVGATSVTDRMPTYEQTSLGTYDAVWMDDAFNTTAAIPFFGNIAVCYAHAGSYSTSSNPTYYWQAYHTLGDASIMPFRVQPTANEISHMAIVPLGMSTYEVSAAPGSFVALSKDGVILGTGLVDESGTINLEIEPIVTGGDVTLCVTHPQRIPEVETIPAAALDGAYVSVNSFTPAATHVNEDTEMSITFKNIGTIATPGNTNIVLSSESEFITILNGEGSFGTLEPESTIEVTGFSYRIADGVADGTTIRVNVTATCGENVWEGKVNLTASAPKLVVSNISNTELVPGGEGTIAIDITNQGSGSAHNAYFELVSSSSDITLSDNTINYDIIDSGETFTVTLNVNVAESVELGSTYELGYVFVSGAYATEGTYVLCIGNLIEDFETGDFSSYPWQFSGNSNWTIDSNNHNSDNYSAKSGVITHSQSSELVLTTEILSNGELSFFKKVSSENSWDKLYFYIDGVEKGNWSGEVEWSQETYPITTGTHTLKWSYKKDSSVSSGSDCAWVDDIQFPPTNVITALASVENLTAVVDDNLVTLTWDPSDAATSYVIRRDGEEVATIAETTYAENVGEGEYTYTVTANDDEGHSSAPSFVTVVVYDTDGVNDNEASFNIYPNPVNGTLYINGGNAEFNYALYNGMGQMVANGNGNGTCNINVSNLTQGIYFIHITSGTQVQIEKIVVK